MDISAGYIQIKVTADLQNKLTSLTDWGFCGIINGENLILNKITVVKRFYDEQTVYVGPTMLTWGDDGRFGIAARYFEQLNPGAKLIFYLEQTGNWGQVQINDGYWANADMVFPEIGGSYITTDNLGGKDVTRIELTLTETVLSHILGARGSYFGLNTDYCGNGGACMIVQGSDMIINKVTVRNI